MHQRGSPRRDLSVSALLLCPSSIFSPLLLPFPHYPSPSFFLFFALSSGPAPLSHSLPPFLRPSPCNKSQSVYKASGAVHNSSGSNCRSIYIRRRRGLASLIRDSVARRVYIPRSDCLSSTLVRLNRCAEPLRVPLIKCKETTKRYSAQGFWEFTGRAR